jgi:hypothetical protein
MVKKIKDVFPSLPKNDDDLVAVSDELWKLGSVDDIKKQVSPELLIAHISMNIIGNHQCDGWASILDHYSAMFPYIPQALEALGLPEIKDEFQNVVTVLPDLSDDQFDKRVEILDDLSDSVWGLSAPQRGWGGVIKYIEDNYNA